MKTSLTVRQILDLGGEELLKKVLKFNQIDPDSVVISSLSTTNTFVFDSEFKFPTINYEKLKIYTFSVGQYEDANNYLIFAYSENEALKKAQTVTDENISKNDLEIINIPWQMFENNGIVLL